MQTHVCPRACMQEHVWTRTVVLPDPSILPDSFLSTLTHVTSNYRHMYIACSYLTVSLAVYCVNQRNLNKFVNSYVFHTRGVYEKGICQDNFF